jgi:hypothetical protein
MLWLLYSPGNTPLPNEEEVGWVPDILENGKISCPNRIQMLDLQPVASHHTAYIPPVPVSLPSLGKIQMHQKRW